NKVSTMPFICFQYKLKLKVSFGKFLCIHCIKPTIIISSNIHRFGYPSTQLIYKIVGAKIILRSIIINTYIEGFLSKHFNRTEKHGYILCECLPQVRISNSLIKKIRIVTDRL